MEQKKKEKKKKRLSPDTSISSCINVVEIITEWLGVSFQNLLVYQNKVSLSLRVDRDAEFNPFLVARGEIKGGDQNKTLHQQPNQCDAS